MPRTDIDWSKLGFGFSDVNCHIRYVWKDGKWSEGELVKDPYITMHIGASCLHYGQECFEGMKAFRQKSGKIVIFRPDENARRMHRTAIRTVMAPVPEEMFIEAAEKVVAANEEFVPPYGTGGSLYLRPLLIGTGPQIGVAPAKEYTFMIMVMPVGAYYKGGLKPVRAVILDDWDRAAPHGMGDVKVGGNYAASLFAHEKAKHDGWPVELYLDAKTHKYVEEFSTSNFLGIKKDGTGDQGVRRSRRVRHGRGGHARMGDHARLRGDHDLRQGRGRASPPEAVRHGAGDSVRRSARRPRLVPRGQGAGEQRLNRRGRLA